MFFSAVLTLYAAVVVGSYVLVLVAALGQLVALLWWLATFVPGGTAGVQRLCDLVWSALGRLIR